MLPLTHQGYRIKTEVSQKEARDNEVSKQKKVTSDGKMLLKVWLGK